MIDYEKLDIAHKICAIHSKKTGQRIRVSVGFNNGLPMYYVERPYNEAINDHNKMPSSSVPMNLDYLVDSLKEYTGIKDKFKDPTSSLICLIDDDICYVHIEHACLDVDKSCYLYKVSTPYHDEPIPKSEFEIFKSLDELELFVKELKSSSEDRYKKIEEKIKDDREAPDRITMAGIQQLVDEDIERKAIRIGMEAMGLSND